MVEGKRRRRMLRATIILASTALCLGNNGYSGGGGSYGGGGNYGGGNYGGGGGSSGYQQASNGAYGGYNNNNNNAVNGNGGNGYNNGYGYGYNSAAGNSGNNYDGYGYYNAGLPITVCEDSVVEVTYLQVSCNSPYTFYYGNGANRDSPTCDYGDKATISGTVTVVDDLQYGDNIYVTMAVYDDNKNILVVTRSVDFCNSLVGQSCTVKGDYSFSTKVKLTSPRRANRTHFYPVVQMAFSTNRDSGYNLGAVNTKCRKWDQNNPKSVEWGNGLPRRPPIVVFFADNGMLIGTCIALSFIAAFIWNKANDESDIELGFEAHKEGLMSLD